MFGKSSEFKDSKGEERKFILESCDLVRKKVHRKALHVGLVPKISELIVKSSFTAHASSYTPWIDYETISIPFCCRSWHGKIVLSRRFAHLSRWGIERCWTITDEYVVAKSEWITFFWIDSDLSIFGRRHFMDISHRAATSSFFHFYFTNAGHLRHCRWGEKNEKRVKRRQYGLARFKSQQHG